MLDRRSEARMMCADMVGVQWTDDSGREHNSTVILEDISASGACLQLDSPIALGTPIEIEYRKGRLEGSVCYCFFREIGYWVGVVFAGKTRWSSRDFRPRHLLDLKKLLAKPKARPAGRKSAQ
jgi:PilZ domain-containing protein